MKNLKCAVSLLLMTAFMPGASCQSRQAAEGSEGSTLQFEETSYDFGQIREIDGKVSHTFKFTNTGKNAVVIENVAVSCGCTASEYSKNPIKPGGQGEITLTYDPDMRPGFFSNSAHIISNGGKNKNVLALKGEVIPRPRSVGEDYPYIMRDGVRLGSVSVNLRYVQQNQPKSQKISYAHTGNKDAKVEFEVSPDDGYVSVASPQPFTPGTKGDITLSVKIPAGKVYGKFVYKVYPVINGEKEVLPISVTGIATDDFSGVDENDAPKVRLSSNFRNFGNVSRGDKPSIEFTIFSEGTKPLVLHSVETESSAIATTLKTGTTLDPGESLKFQCELDTGKAAEAGLFMQTITIMTNDPVRSMREIRLAATLP